MRRRRLAVALVLPLVLAACGAAPAASVTGGRAGLHGTEVGDVIARPALALPDTGGAPFALRARPAGELTAVFFGYTRCPDLCPTTMADLAAARRQLGSADRARVRVVFVTEDPATDTPPVLRAWLDRFDPSFVGLAGGDEPAEAVLDALKAPRTTVRPAHDEAGAPPHTHPDGRGGTVEHTGSVYAFRGDRVVVYTGGTTAAEYAEDFTALLHS